MEHGQVRAILGRHAQLAPGAAPGASALRSSDPTALVPASSLRKALEGLDDAGQRALAHDYVRLWSRTFRTLARHLRGRPERALALFAEEVYPFLRGDRRAARVERAGRHGARILLPDDLPPAYQSGLVEAFAGLSGAEVHAVSRGQGGFDVTFRVAGAGRVARASQTVASLRAPLLLAALLAALAGLGLAGPPQPGVLAAVLGGILAAQAAANLLHDARRARRHPFAPPALPRRTAAAASALLYGVAGACAAWLAFAADRPLVLAFAAGGLALGLAYSAVRQRGLGPALAGVTYGLLVPAGAAYAADPAALAGWVDVAWLALAAAPLGLVCAAQLFLDNLADRPLDEAGGQRTLAVRLPHRGQSAVFAGLLAGAAVLLAAFAIPAFSPFHLIAALALAVAAAVLAASVRRHLDDPHDLAPARLGAVALLATLGLFQAWWLVGA